MKQRTTRDPLLLEAPYSDGKLTERRRYPRKEICVPITVYVSGETLEGYTENISYTGVLVQLVEEELPSIGEACEMTLDLISDRVEALGKVTRVNSKKRQFAIDITSLEHNGDMLLALLMR